MLLDAISRGRLYQVKFLLDSRSVNVNVTDHNGQTPLMKAILLDDKMHHTRYKIVRLLLDHGAQVNLADKDGKTALMLAVIYGQKDVAERILKCSVMDIDLNAGDYEGNTALIHAALRGREVITGLLIASLKRFGLGVDKINHRGVTAMLEAVRCGHGRCAHVLMVEGNASLTIRDPIHFMNAEEWAVQNHLFNLVGLIEKAKQEAAASSFRNSSQKPTDNAWEKPETSNLELPTADNNYCETSSRPESPRDRVTKRPVSKTSTVSRSSTLTVGPRVIMRNFRRASQESEPSEIEHSRIPSPKELTKDNYPRLVADSPTFMNENEAKGSRDLFVKSESSFLLTKRPRSSHPRLRNGHDRCSSAKTDVQRLLELYGVQSSMAYRKGYDPTTLPPSGMWPDPSESVSDSVENLNGFDRESEHILDSPCRLTSRRSMLSEASTRRTSIVGNLSREGRKMSIIAQGNSSNDRRTSVVGRKFTVGQPPSRNVFEAFGRKPSERKMSMATRTNLERPILRRIHSNLSSLGR